MTDLNTFKQNYLAPGQNTPQPSFLQKNVFTPIKNAFSGAVNEVKTGYQETQAPASPVGAMGNLIKGGFHIAEGLVGIPGAVAAPVVQRPIGAGVNAIADTVSNSPAVQNFANSTAGKVTANIASGAGTVANIAGGVAGVQGGAELAGNIWEKAYHSTPTADVATLARDQAAQNAIKATQNINAQVEDFKSGLGDAFSQAPKQIETINPQARVTIPSEVMDRLNELKDTKKFALPDYLRTSSPEFGSSIKLGDIENGGTSLSPSEAQDLITRLNKLTYAAKASGDLEINQSTIGLNKDIHSLSSEAFKNIKDATGRSIWDSAYENYAKGANAVDKLSDIVNTDKAMTATDFSKTMNNIVNLSKTPEGKIALQNSLDEFKNVSGIDLTNPTQEINKILSSEDFLKESQKPGFLKQAFNRQYMTRAVVRIVEYTVVGSWLRKLLKNQ